MTCLTCLTSDLSDLSYLSYLSYLSNCFARLAFMSKEPHWVFWELSSTKINVQLPKRRRRKIFVYDRQLFCLSKKQQKQFYFVQKCSKLTKVKVWIVTCCLTECNTLSLNLIRKTNSFQKFWILSNKVDTKIFFIKVNKNEIGQSLR